ncbi:MarR family transcriptional regulator [Geoglobus sp.]
MAREKDRLATAIKILKAIAEIPDPAFGDILNATGLSRPSLSEHLKELENKGLILSEQSEADRRKYIYHINTAELALLTIDEAIEAIKKELEEAGMELEPSEEEELRKALKGMHEAMVKALFSDELERVKPMGLVLLWLDGLVFNRYLLSQGLSRRYIKEGMKATARTAREKGLDSGEIEKILVDNCLDHIPASFAEKWIKAREAKNILLRFALMQAEAIRGIRRGLRR